jgi:hypothetical protein
MNGDLILGSGGKGATRARKTLPLCRTVELPARLDQTDNRGTLPLEHQSVKHGDDPGTRAMQCRYDPGMGMVEYRDEPGTVIMQCGDDPGAVDNECH